MNRPIFVLVLLFSSFAFTQNYTQNIKGRIIDATIQQPLPYASVVILGTNPVIGTSSDEYGYFLLEDVPIGRYDVEFSFLGYETVIKPEIIVTSTKEVILNIALVESVATLKEVLLRPRVDKSNPINGLATVSAKRLSVEEVSRYAGGFDDPARLVSAFPGVASNTQDNAIVVRGNSPTFLQWKIEGVEVPNPNHFANLETFGGGGLTAISNNLLANSDFFTGAFPAEYNNALSGIFDIRMRTGNNSDFEHGVEVGALGIDITSEGPINKKSGASYLANYRYSTLDLLSSLLPEDAEGTSYQDLSFKLNFPTKNSGIFSFWGIGLLDESGSKPETDEAYQKYYQDIEKQNAKQFMGATGLNHRIVFDNDSYLNSTVAITVDGLDMYTDRLNSNNELQPQDRIDATNATYTLKSFYNKKISSKHSNRTGITLKGLAYDLLLQETDGESGLNDVVSEKGFSSLISSYSSSSFRFKKFKINLGLNFQWFTLNNNISLEPRFGASYLINSSHKLSIGYGLHSRLEPLNLYFSNTSNTSPQSNKDLDFSKAHHLVFSYDWNITDKLHLKVEPYYQLLFDIPIVENSTESLLNLEQEWFIYDAYKNAGKGRNYGVDLTLEQYINNGLYFLISGSLFNSEYKTDLNEWYNTRFNKHFLFNALVGKEFRIGKSKQNLISFNARINVQGGDRFSKVDDQASSIAQDVVYDETNPFTQHSATSLITHFTVNYEWYKKKTTQRLSFRILNANNFKEFYGHRYNLLTDQVDEYREALMVPNISYRISF